MTDEIIGGFYAIRLIPDVSSHLKLGWTRNFRNRLASHRIACPLAEILRTWPCSDERMERDAMNFAEACGFERIGTTEVFICAEPEALFACLDNYFNIAQWLTPPAKPPRIYPHKNTKGEGTIYQRSSDGRWCGQVTMPDGRRKSFYGKKRREVAEKMWEVRSKILALSSEH